MKDPVCAMKSFTPHVFRPLVFFAKFVDSANRTPKQPALALPKEQRPTLEQPVLPTPTPGPFPLEPRITKRF